MSYTNIIWLINGNNSLFRLQSYKLRVQYYIYSSDNYNFLTGRQSSMPIAIKKALLNRVKNSLKYMDLPIF